MNPIITLQDFPKERTFISLKKGSNQRLISLAIQKASSQRLLANQIKLNLNFPKIKQATISGWLRRDFLRLDLVVWLIDYKNLNIKLERKIEKLKGEATSRPINNIILPVYMSENLAGILANIYCDGTTSDRNSATTQYFNQNEMLLTNFKNSLRKIFGKIEISEFYNKETKVICLNVPHFFRKITL